MQQARPRAALEEAVGAGAQQERALQRRDGAVHRPDRGERAVIVAVAVARAAVLEDLRRPVVGGDQDVGERLVVAQQHVEARAQPLDQIGFEQQRLGLGLGGDEFERGGGRDHALDARVVAGRPRIGGDALPDVLGLADIEHVAVRIDHAVDAGRGRRVLGVAQDGGAAGGERPGAAAARSMRAGLELRAASARRRPRRGRSAGSMSCRCGPFMAEVGFGRHRGKMRRCCSGRRRPRRASSARSFGAGRRRRRGAMAGERAAPVDVASSRSVPAGAAMANLSINLPYVVVFTDNFPYSWQ